jgi:hypothetical protein
MVPIWLGLATILSKSYLLPYGAFWKIKLHRQSPHNPRAEINFLAAVNRISEEILAAVVQKFQV